LRSLRVPALVAGVGLISAAVAMGVLGSRASQARSDTIDGQLNVAARQVGTSLTQTFERVRTIDLMLANQPSFAAFVADPRPPAVKLRDSTGNIKDIDTSLRFLDELLAGQLDSAGFADIHGNEIARFAEGRLALIGSLGNIKTEPFFTAPLLMGPDAVYRTDPFLTDTTNNWVVAHSTLVTNNGSGTGVVYFSITMDSLRTAMLGAAQHGEVLRVLDGKTGLVVMDSRVSENALLNSSYEGLKPVMADDREFAGEPGLLRRSGTTTEDGARMSFAAVTNAQEDAGSGWVVVVSTPAVGVSGWLGSLGWFALGLLVLGVGLLGVGVVGSVRLVRARRVAAGVAVDERDVLAARLEVMSGALARVGAGDLGVVLPVEEFAGGDEVLGGLVAGFEETIGRLRVLVEQAQGSGELVAGAASELLVLAGRQADSAGEQSAAVTETTVTIQELAATASQIAESAGGVATVAGEMLVLTESGRTAVSDSVAAMGRIAVRVGSITESTGVLGEKVNEIGGILVLLDDLSDQTNLLALNAAIEAARAGEHGRGFAVVAGEVRKLAERARTSTGRIQSLVGEIHGLMQATVAASGQGAAEVAVGSGLAADAVAVLEAIAGRVDEAAAAVKEISVATAQQRSASEQVVVAMTRLSQVSTMYAAGSRQAAASAQELAGLAASMQASIETFRTSGDDPASPDQTDSRDRTDGYGYDATEDSDGDGRPDLQDADQVSEPV
jgi:methyl-accepting chemotaxis protein